MKPVRLTGVECHCGSTKTVALSISDMDGDRMVVWCACGLVSILDPNLPSTEPVHDFANKEHYHTKQYI